MSVRLDNSTIESITTGYIRRRFKDQEITYETLKHTMKQCIELRKRIPIQLPPTPSTSPNSLTPPSPKALFILGSAGSGKSYVVEKLLPKPLPIPMYLYNPDQYVETLMDLFQLPTSKKNDDGANADLDASIRDAFHTHNPEMVQEGFDTIKEKWTSRMIQWFLGQGKECSFEDFDAIVKTKASIVIDRPGDSLESKSRNPKDKSVYQQMQYLHNHGYQIYIVLVTADEKTCLKRNRARKRSLPDPVVEGICQRFNALIPKYQAIAEKNKWPLIIYDNNVGISPSKRITLPSGTPSVTEWLSSSA
jgi:hypothetical protein